MMHIVMQINKLPPMPPSYTYTVTLNLELLVSALFKITGMLIAAMSISTAAIALPLLAINRKLAVMNAGLAGNLATELLRERSARIAERKPHA